MTLLGIIWMIYGIGLKGPDPSWAEVPGRTVLQDTDALYQAQVFEQRVEVPEDATFDEEAEIVAAEFAAEGWELLSEDAPAFGQAAAAAGEFLEETGSFAAGEYQAVHGVRHRRRALPDDRELRPLRLLPQAALRGRRGGAARTDPHRGRPRPAGARRSTTRASGSTST